MIVFFVLGSNHLDFCFLRLAGLSKSERIEPMMATPSASYSGSSGLVWIEQVDTLNTNARGLCYSFFSLPRSTNQPPRLTSSPHQDSLIDFPGTKEVGSADQQWDLPELQKITKYVL